MSWTKVNAFDNKSSRNPPFWPNEMLVKICSSARYSNLFGNLTKDSRVLEVGAFSGNNARFFIENGFEYVGSEINQEMLELCESSLRDHNYSIPKLVLGSNTKLEAQDCEFDLLVSINTIHYSAGHEMIKAIREFARVIRQSGFAIIETAGQRHDAVVQSTRVAEFEYMWKAGGFRNNSTFGFFDSPNHLRDTLGAFFSDVQICTRLESYEKTNLEFYVAICKK